MQKCRIIKTTSAQYWCLEFPNKQPFTGLIWEILANIEPLPEYGYLIEKIELIRVPLIGQLLKVNVRCTKNSAELIMIYLNSNS